MEKIASFQMDHLRLKRGVFVSRKDTFGATTLTTFDLRMKEPNREPVMDTPVMHTFEHLGATFLRSHPDWTRRIVYFGPMGCRTGCYVIIEGNLESRDVLGIIRQMCEFIVDFEGDIPGAAPAECGNWRDHNLEQTKWETERYLEVLRRPLPENLEYPK